MMIALRYDKKTCVILISYCFSIALSILLIGTFVYAYFFNHMQYHIAINNYGEATTELLLLSAIGSIILLGFYYYYKHIAGVDS